MSKFVSWVMVICLLGFVIAYIVTVKELVPQVIKIFKCGATWDSDGCTLPTVISDGRWSGQVVWGTIFAFGVVFPLSIPRSMAAL